MGTVNLAKKTVNLSKSETINLSKSSDDGLKEVLIGLGWDEATKSSGGFLSKLFGGNSGQSQYDFDLDAWAAFGKNGVFDSSNICYYGKLNFEKKGNLVAKHHGDNLTGAGAGDDEQITIHLDKIPEEFNQILIGVTIYQAASRHQSFADIKNTFVRVVDKRDNFEICKYEDNLGKDSTTFIVGSLYKDKGDWNFKAAGIGTKDSSISAAATNYKG